MKQLLILLCFLTVAAALWLAVMENSLKHDGYAGRTMIAACIVAQSLGTLLLIASSGRSVFRNTVVAGAVVMAVFGASAVLRIEWSAHFEGFVLIIGLALIVQGVLTVATVLHGHLRTTKAGENHA